MVNEDGKGLSESKRNSLKGTGDDEINSIISAAVGNLTAEQKGDIAKIAVEERLRLQSKAAEQGLDYEHARRQIDDHQHTFQNLDKSGNLTRHKITTDVKSGAGNTRIESKSGANCFVATAAFGRADHPTVQALREWRDDVLIKSHLGRLFINIYWYVGPKLALLVEGNPILKSKCQKILNWIVSKLGS